ncbi:MAG: (Fe-S)-binding protein [Acidimicrobiia bacterium]
MAKVQLFVTCLVDSFAPDVGEAVVDVLERHGCTVEFPFDQTCCGQPAFNVGYHDQAKAMAEHTIRLLDATEGTIVVPSGSCADMMINHSPELLAEDDALLAAAHRVAARVREFSSFLVDDLGITDARAACHGKSAVYHPSCHGFRNLGIRSQPESLLDAVAGLERLELPDAENCCGFGGLFSVEMPDVSAAMMSTKLTNVETSGANLLVGIDVSCLMHLEGGLRRRGSEIEVKHLAQVLNEEPAP